MKYLALFLMCFVFATNAFGQPVDCMAGPESSGAIGICSNTNLNENSSGNGMDDFINPNNNSGCINEEHESAWLFLQIDEGSTLGFIIDPVGAHDYDFAVYGPNVSCDNLGAPIRCSWAAGSSNTGLAAWPNDNSEGAGGDGFVRWLNVEPGESYFILIDNFSTTNVGFDLTWTGDASLNCDVTLPCPVFELGDDIVLCEAENRVIGVDGLPNELYLWNTGQTSSEITVAEAGTYWLSVTKGTCTLTDTIRVTYSITPEVNLGPDTSLCNPTSFVLDAESPIQTATYEWQDGTTNPTFNVEESGTYIVEVENEGCLDSDTISVTFQTIPVFSLGADTFLCKGTEYLLSVNDQGEGTTFLWSNNSTGSSIIVTSEGNYFVEVTNSCRSAYDSIRIEFESCNCNIYFPTGLTPNNDGMNDLFGPLLDCDSLQEYSIEIYNRWGESLFESNDPNTFWDVSDKNKYPMDSYVWVTHYKWTWRGREMTGSDSGSFVIFR